MFNVTDTYFAGSVSTVALAALSLTFSIFFLIIAIAGGMSQALTALIGNALGEGKKEHAKQIILHSVLVAIFLSLALTMIGFLISPFLMKILGAKGLYLKEALSYIYTIFAGVIFFIGAFFTNAVLNSLGNTKAYRNFLIVGFLANTLLDFWFVKGGIGLPALGIIGIASATIIIECGGALYLFFELKKTYLLTDMPKFKFDMQIIKSFFSQGVPPTINMSLMALGMFIITYYISHFGQHVVAAYGIAVRIEQIVLLPAIGINVAVLSIVSQNCGAQLYDRVKQTVKYAQNVGFFLWIIGMLFIYLFGNFTIHLFTQDEKVAQAGLGYLYAAATSLYAYMLVFINVSLLQGIKQPTFLIYLSLFRQIIFPVFVFTIFLYLNLPLTFYWWGIVFTIWFSAFLIVWYAKNKLAGIV